MVHKVIVQQSFVGLLYEDGAFKGVLAPGRYEFSQPWFGKAVDRKVEMVEVRERSVTIKGQEILTKDKVAIRVSLLVYYQVEDAEAALHHVANYEERIYEDVQLAARRALASRELDAILSDRNEISDAVRQDVSAIAAGYGVKIVRADVKDFAFPGNLREIMNQVLETERRAEARLIEARREVESLKIKSDAENAAARARIEAEQERALMVAEVERERFRARLASEIEEARALHEHPEMLRLREMEALAEMARSGGRFVVGLPAGAAGLSLRELSVREEGAPKGGR